MTLNDFLKRVDIEKDGDKIILFDSNGGWSNIDMYMTDNTIWIKEDCKNPFSDGG